LKNAVFKEAKMKTTIERNEWESKELLKNIFNENNEGW